MSEKFPRGDTPKVHPSDTLAIADKLATTLGVTGEAIKISPEERSVQSAKEVVGLVHDMLAKEHPEWSEAAVDVEADTEIADMVDASHADGVAQYDRDVTAVVAIVDEIQSPGEKVPVALAADPETFTRAVEISATGGVDHDKLAAVVQKIEELENHSDEVLQRKLDEIEADDSRRHNKYSQELWREDLFGTKEFSHYRTDIRSRLETSAANRVGQAVIDRETGIEKKPIMNLELGTDEAGFVKAAIEARSKGVAMLREVLTKMSNDGVKMEAYELEELYVAHNIWPRSFGSLGDELPKDPRGMIADLYIDSDDLRAYRELDMIANDINSSSAHTIDTERNVENRFITLASTMFPAGVEMMHVVNKQGVDAVRSAGYIGPRSQHRYGENVGRKNLNGGFVHFTGPSRVAYEYGGGNGVGANSYIYVIGVPIDTVVKNSPFLMLEDSYIGNRHGPAGRSSTQERLGKMQIHGLDTDQTPQIFRDRFVQMQKSLAEGPHRAMIGQGNYDNYGFAASSTKEDASRYRYELSECTEYGPTKADIVKRGLKNFDLGGDTLTVFAPVEQVDVAFTESSLNDLGNEYTFANVEPGYVGSNFAQLLGNPNNDIDALRSALQLELRDAPSKLDKTLQSYKNYVEEEALEAVRAGEKSIDAQVGITFKDILDAIPDSSFAELQPTLYPVHTPGLEPQIEQKINFGMMHDFVAKMRHLARQGVMIEPNWVDQPGLRAMGFVPTQEEAGASMRYDEELRRKDEERQRNAVPVPIPRV